ncbi:MAG: gliding motility-associated C-terminal domain-containing protein [Bacteroidota bacterium]
MKNPVKYFVVVILNLSVWVGLIPDNTILADTQTYTCPFSTIDSLVLSSTSVICNLDNNGNVALYVYGGNGPFSYDWSGNPQGDGTDSIYNLSPGFYSIIVTDLSDGSICVGGPIEVEDIAPLSLPIFPPTPVTTCFDTCDGSAFVGVTGGTPPYTYLWTGSGETTASADSLCAGINWIIVTDANNCIDSASTNVGEPPPLVVAISYTNITCNGTCDGTVTASASGGTPPYTYSWNTGDSITALDSLCQGTFIVTVIDFGGCTAIGSAVIIDPPPLILSTDSTDVSCGGACDGIAVVAPSGGTPPYTYTWNSTPVQTDSMATGLCAGIYRVIVTDIYGCGDTAFVNIDESPVLTSDISDSTNISCSGSCDGTATVTSNGGIPPYTYSWNDPLNQTNSTTTGLCADTLYMVVVTDSSGCKDTSYVTLSEPPPLTSSITDSTNISCNGLCDGTATVTPGGGTPPYTYLWDDPLAQTDSLADSLCALVLYTVIVTDANGCTDTSEITLSEPIVLTTDITDSVNINCNSSCDGTATVTPTGGTSPYTYSWNTVPVQTGTTATGLCAGITYTVVVTDSNGCKDSVDVTLIEPPPLTSSITDSTNLSCGGVCTGTATVTPGGGTPPYTYSWDDPSSQTDSTATGLCASILYTVIVTDTYGCKDTSEITLSEPLPITISITDSANISCYGLCDGTATVTPVGGTPPFTYLWDDPATQTNSMATGLCAGTLYTVIVTDTIGCSDTTDVTLSEPSILTVSIPDSTDASCSGVCDGDATASPSGGTPPYTYTWNTVPPQTGSVATGLCGGNYCVIVTDANDCQDSACVNIFQPLAISPNSGSNPATCGFCDGEAGVAPSGGIPPYTFNWYNEIPPSANDSIYNLCAGFYPVEITDSIGCIDTFTVIVIDFGGATLIFDSTDVTCNGLCDGTATVAPSGGTPPYTYLWNTVPAQTDSMADSLCAGVVFVQVTDSIGCVNIDPVSVNEPPPLILVTTVTDVLCAGDCNGEIIVTPSGGTPPYTYLWDDPGTQTSSTAGSLCAGIYTVTVTDNNGCDTTASDTVNQPLVLTAVTSGTNMNCNGICDGTTTATPSGGTPPYTYLWNDPGSQTNSTADSLCAGIYTVTITDTMGCTIVPPGVTVNEPPLLTLTTDSLDVNCNGICEGEATVIPSGGTTPYTYLWDDTGTQTDSTATGLCAGTYCVIVTDANGCQDSACVNIDEPSLLTLFAGITNISCNGLCDGTATVTPSGGIPLYTYLWDDPSSQTNSTATGLCADTLYTVVVTDANGCKDSLSGTLSEPQSLISSITDSTNISCNGICDGTATVTPAGGIPPYTYSWDDPLLQTDSVADSLCAGILYMVIITDANGCMDTTEITPSEPIVLTLNITDSTNISCNGLCDGSATVTPVGGTQPYTYLWIGGDTLADSINSSLCAGVLYTVVVTDTNGCQDSSSVILSEPLVLTSGITDSTNLVCNGICDGSATVTPGGGTPPYTYSWNTLPFQTGSTATGLCAGVLYTAIVTDSNGCEDSSYVTLSEPPVLSSSITNSTNITCNGLCDGSATVTTVGGTLPYTFAWSGGATPANPNNTGLCAWVLYTVIVTDANGCKDTSAVTLSEPNIFSASITDSTDASCNGSCDGNATVTPLGGTAPYTYSWNSVPSQTDSVATGLCAGTYCVILTDVNGCMDSACVIINEPAIMLPTLGSIDAACSVCDGIAWAAPSGGTPPYTFNWYDPPQPASDSIFNLCAGIYCLELSDANGCIDTSCVGVSNIGGPILTTDSTDVTCNGTCDGTATITPSGGTPPYTYLWNDTYAQTDSTADSLCAGTYLGQVTDALSCITISSVTVNEPMPLVSNISSVNISCNGLCDGMTWIAPTGGTPLYTYQWDDPGSQTTDTIAGLCPDTFIVTITDSNSCTLIDTAIITEPQVLTSGITDSANISCNGLCDGDATVSLSGGTLPYTYSWSNGDSTAMSDSLCAGVLYSVAITDANGCTDTSYVTLSEPDILTSGITDSTNINCNGLCDGSAIVTPVGGTSPYTYLWNTTPVQTDSTVTGLCADSLYSVIVTDANGCLDTSYVTLSEPVALSSGITDSINIICNGLCDGYATVTPVGGTPAYAYSWNTIPVQTDSSATGLCAGNYCATVTDANGCTDTSCVTITEPAALISSITDSVMASCNGVCDGEATVTPAGGIPPYTYLWDPATGGQTGSTADSLCAGSYCVEITDSNGCVDTSCVVITEPLVLTSSTTDIVNASCTDTCDGSAIVTPSGGTTPYTYLWDDTLAQTDSSATGLCVGTYNVIITDANGCVDTSTVTITEPTTLMTQIDATCFGICDGVATVTPQGGTPPYTYLWDDSLAQTGSTATGLCEGTYIVLVTDVNGCEISDTAIIIAPSSVASQTNVTCNGLCDGTATVVTTGGFTPFTYLWDDPSSQSNSTATGLCPGMITITVTDSIGCITIDSVNITEPNILTTSITNFANMSCFGIYDGEATVTPVGGTLPYTYLWDDPQSQTSSTADSLWAGTYCVVTADTNGCSDTSCVTITEPDSLTSTITYITHINCNGSCEGIAIVTPTGGTLPYTYLWDDPGAQTDSTANSLCAGSYCVVITDANGCADTSCVTITEPTVFSTSITDTTHIVCGSICTGDAIATPAGGIPPYTYSWNTTPVQTDSTATGLCAGTYCIVISDANGCTDTSCVTITEPTVLTINLISTTPASCSDTCDGGATVMGIGGTPPYTYSWNTIPVQTDPSLGSLCAGTYIVTVADANGCDTSLSVIIIGPDSLTSTISNITNTSCAGVCDGEATVTVSGGSPPYTYSWEDSFGVPIPGETGTIIDSVCAGNYTAVITDNNGCITTTPVTITQPSIFTCSITNSTDATCYGICDGTATVTPSGGTPPYSYLWDNSLAQTDSTAIELCANTTYNVAITDANGCFTACSMTISEPIELTVSITDTTHVSCNGLPTGTATATPVGGTTPYTYLWNTTPSQTDSIADSLWAGDYSITITDLNGCSANDSVSIRDTSNMDANITDLEHVPCYGDCDGEATVTVTGSTTPYTYQWEDSLGVPIPGETGSLADSLCTGNYSVIITSAENCTRIVFVTISEPPSPLIAIITDSINVLCNSDSNGTATVTPSGGTPPYTYLWSPVLQTDSTADSLFAGYYYVTVTDTNGCIVTDSVTITEPPILTVTITDTTNSACVYTCDGSAVATPSGGTLPYTYLWNDPVSQTDSTATALCTGDYLVSVTDSNECQATDSITITPITIVISDAGFDTLICIGTSATLIANGGVTYEWFEAGNPSSFSTSDSVDVSPTEGGSHEYILIAYDGICADTDIVVVFVDIVPANAGEDVIIDLGSSIELQASGGFIYLWTTSDGLSDTTISNPVATPLETVTYYVTVTDINGCSAIDTITLIVIETIPDGITPNGDGFNDVWEIKLLDLYPDASVEVYNRWGEKVFNSPKGEKYANKFDGTYNGKKLPVGTYYFIIVLDAVSEPITGPITIMR